MNRSEESSVVFNLAEIMKLEEKRIDGELAAEREALEALRAAQVTQQCEEQRQREDGRRRDRERLEEQAARRDAERDAILLRARLEVEADERLRHEALVLRSSPTCDTIVQTPSAGFSGLVPKAVPWLPWLALGAAAAAGLGVARAASRDLADLGTQVEALREGEARARRDARSLDIENAALMERVRLAERKRADTSVVAAQPGAAPQGGTDIRRPGAASTGPAIAAHSRARASRSRPRSRGSRRRSVARRSASEDESALLDGLESSDPDPLKGLTELGD